MRVLSLSYENRLVILRVNGWTGRKEFAKEGYAEQQDWGNVII